MERVVRELYEELAEKYWPKDVERAVKYESAVRSRMKQTGELVIIHEVINLDDDEAAAEPPIQQTRIDDNVIVVENPMPQTAPTAPMAQPVASSAKSKSSTQLYRNGSAEEENQRLKMELENMELAKKIYYGKLEFECMMKCLDGKKK
uniref:Uncharacterized protein n=1 Tax=Panagrolaimus sp. ES5 TaxID=591445 RepID=A0AC34GTJ0_9BILA